MYIDNFMIALFFTGLTITLVNSALLRLKNKRQQLEITELKFKLILIKQKYEARKSRPLQGFRR